MSTTTMAGSRRKKTRSSASDLAETKYRRPLSRALSLFLALSPSLSLAQLSIPSTALLSIMHSVLVAPAHLFSKARGSIIDLNTALSRDPSQTSSSIITRCLIAFRIPELITTCSLCTRALISSLSHLWIPCALVLIRSLL